MTAVDNTYLTVKEFTEKFSFPTKTSIRWYIFYNKKNFATKCTRRIGRKILIYLGDYLSWIEEEGKING